MGGSDDLVEVVVYSCSGDLDGDLEGDLDGGDNDGSFRHLIILDVERPGRSTLSCTFGKRFIRISSLDSNDCCSRSAALSTTFCCSRSLASNTSWRRPMSSIVTRLVRPSSSSSSLWS